MALRAFISSKMQELAPERGALRAALTQLDIEPFTFEDDAGARPDSIESTYLDETEAAELYIGLFWKGYGAHTITEFEHARALGLDCLVYVKQAGSGERDPQLESFLARIGEVRDGVTAKYFATTEELEAHVAADVSAWWERITTAARDAQQATIAVGVPSRPATGFVGRQRDVLGIVRQLVDGSAVAIDGLPGVGKTTLALVLARQPRICRKFRDGILWASLGPNADIASTLADWTEGLHRAELIDADAAGPLEPTERARAIQDAIGDRRMLLVLDDVWDPEAAASLRCGGPRCSYLLTTRDKGIARRFAGAEHARSLATLDRAEGFALLRALAPEACAADPEAAARLLDAVGGLPQAIRTIGGYLAAPDASMYADVFPELGVDAFAEMQDPATRLQQPAERLGRLEGQTLTLHDTIALSVRDLPDAARAAFYALGSFAPKPRTFSARAAQEVADASAANLALLAARNLVEVDTASRELALHPTLADVACTRLDPGSVLRHREHYLDFVKEQRDQWRNIEAAYGQIRWAWQQAPNDETLYPFIGLLEGYQIRRGLSAETLTWAQRALRVAEQRDVLPAVAHLAMVIGKANNRLGRFDDALGWFRRSLGHWAELGQTQQQLDCRQSIGFTLARAGKEAQARRELDLALAAAREAGDRLREAECLLIVGYLERNAGTAAQGVEPATQALAIYRELDHSLGEADALGLLGTIYRNLGETDRALALIGQAKAIWDSLSYTESAAEARMAIATVYGEQGRMEEALTVADTALTEAQSSGDRTVLVQSLKRLGDMQANGGLPDAALVSFERRLALEEEAGNLEGQADTHRDIGWLHWKQHRPELALQHYERALDHYKALGNRSDRADSLEQLHFVYRALARPEAEAACLNEALAIWEELGSARQAAQTWQNIGHAHALRDAHDEALAAYVEAAERFATLGDAAGQARALSASALLNESLAGSAVEDRLLYLERAISAIDAASVLTPDNPDYARRLAALRTRRRYADRFGARLVYRDVGVTPVTLTIGGGPGEGGDSGVSAAAARAVATARDRVQSALGIAPPQVHTESGAPSGRYVLQLQDVPFVMAEIPAGARLFTGPTQTLEALRVSAEPTVNPLNGRAAAWIRQEDWHAVAEEGYALWGFADYLAAHLEDVLKRNLWRFTGHREVMGLLDTWLPDAADRFRAKPRELAVLVGVVRSLIEEGAPVHAVPAIIDTFLRIHAGDADRLAIVEAVRALPQVRELLPGNNGTHSLCALSPGVETILTNALTIADGQTVLAPSQETTQSILAAIRAVLAPMLSVGDVALVVQSSAIRRFARKLVELEFPQVPLLSRQELAPELSATVLDCIDVEAPQSAARPGR